MSEWFKVISSSSNNNSMNSTQQDHIFFLLRCTLDFYDYLFRWIIYGYEINVSFFFFCHEFHVFNGEINVVSFKWIWIIYTQKKRKSLLSNLGTVFFFSFYKIRIMISLNIFLLLYDVFRICVQWNIKFEHKPRKQQGQIV